MADLESIRVDYDSVEITKELGKGAFGVIYEGTYKGTSIAVKKLILPTSPSLSLENVPDSDKMSFEERNEVVNVFEEFRREVWMMKYVLYT
jgi:hypothetical protein